MHGSRLGACEESHFPYPREQMFHSVLKSQLRSFFAFKRGLGFGYVRAEETLRHFDRHVCRVLSDRIREGNLQALVESWMTRAAFSSVSP